MKCNINIQVYVKLNTLGINALREHYESLKIPERYWQEPEFDGTYKFALWNLMQIFGSHFYIGGNQLFENNEIIFVK
ncbi:hypothetical protein [Paenibacillus tianjinensis]|uniref:Uncharacterized protein n=1 Tax=Paenibacillus tianjinensis TaxID=2810347 RepID=A0ABX7L8P5_9BACL|nr:hypothetical protein [Paenibacillus tianjinensis]QSF43399.1 hypothetical protein JRJ22_19220 [Paenibacillus tianjinensis]